ncbi:anthranilate n-hydroxycinnamoyl benzoyltransferase [Diplogelasinospora grovesii]|uniref:Anthranilate n-hydroxycinnamoyl benzoyltransferase n=1 Tax=Diplogelasinospora grovesii TaxID=303347 RepID=A0AAN6MY31_9PEZI|nr:anthranilate n-hydroxycinnamoyl benzoyltransferase [Diplogelasinospora grovesii]
MPAAKTMGYKTLSTWNQMAPRVYTGHCFCFPYLPNGNLHALESHLRTALDALTRRIPFLRQVIKPHPDHPDQVCLFPSENANPIPLKISDERHSFGWTYRQLKSQGFPAKAFVGTKFDLPPSLPTHERGVHVFGVEAKLIDGGLLLINHLHHSVTDGVGRTLITNAFASLTRDPSGQSLADAPPIDIHAEVPAHLEQAPDPALPVASLLARCPEYRLLDAPYGPTIPYLGPPGPPFASIRRTGRIFVVAPHALARLRQQLGGGGGAKAPSSFTCLAALTWAHATKARLASAAAADRDINGDEAHAASDGTWDDLGKGNGQTARIVTVVNWRQRALGRALRCLARAIEASARGVDDGFVATRTALFRRFEDIRMLGIDGDPRDARAFAFNTWRYVYKGTPGWGLPGVPVGGEGDGGEAGVQPDAIRRSQKEWDMGYGFILPERKGFDGLEVLVTLEPDAMDALLADKAWMSWVEEVIE